MLDRQAQSLEGRVAEFVKGTHRKDVRETVLASVFIAIFTLDIVFKLSKQDDSRLSIVGGSLIIVALLLNITFIWWKLHISPSKLSKFSPTEFPERWRNYLMNRARLLRLSGLWFLLPLFSGLIIYILSLYDRSPISFIILLLFEIASLMTATFMDKWHL